MKQLLPLAPGHRCLYGRPEREEESDRDKGEMSKRLAEVTASVN